MTNLFASEGGYQLFTLGRAEWFWLVFTMAVALLALVVGGFTMRGVLAKPTGTKEMGEIAGQHPVITKAKKSIANFKLREGMPIGCKVTLRGERMYEFLDKLFNISLARVRDFHGVSATAFDGRGNYTLGVKEQLIFPEINFDKVGKVRGMDIVIVTTANTNKEAYALLKEMGMPFSKGKED